MGTNTGTMQRLPRVIVATFVVAVCPSLAAWGLRASGAVSSVVLSILIAALLSFALCQAGSWHWEKRRASRDVLFADLMIWSWGRRWLIDRRVSNAVAQLELDPVSLRLRRTPMALGAQQRMELLERLAADLEARDPYTHRHSRRVARYASLVASRLGLPHSEVATIRAAAALHDVGKLHTPTAILNKPGSLTDGEFAQVKRHAADGARMIRILLEDEELTAIVRHHHERLDGSGYPSGLEGEEIPLGARIIAVADTFDAITSERPYRPGRSHKTALGILRAEAGTKLDADAVQSFFSIYFGRRPLGALVLSSSVVGRLLSGLASRVADTGAWATGIATTVAAVGVAASALPMPDSHSVSRGRIAHPSLAAPRATVPALLASRGLRPNAAQRLRALRGQPGSSPRPARARSQSAMGSISTIGRQATNGQAVQPTGPQGGSGGATQPAADGAGQSAPAPTSPSVPSVAASVHPGTSGVPAVSASVTPAGAGSPSVSATAGASGASASVVGINVGGH